MIIAITGSRGIPNRYGGFEQFSEKLSAELARRGHDVSVYCRLPGSDRPESFGKVRLVYRRLPEKTVGPAANFIYDYNCLRDAIRQKADVILECGYASAAPWYPFLNNGNTKIITHMDGMEWQRAKWNKPIRLMIRRHERTAVKHSDELVCDNPVISEYYNKTYGINPPMISYGADIREEWNSEIPVRQGLNPKEYYLLVARLEPENNIRTIINGFLASGVPEPLIIIGDTENRFGRSLAGRYRGGSRIRFFGGIFDPGMLDNLRHFARASFHGHTVGGTNPSLLEAMAAGSALIAHDNPYNRWVLGEYADYFNASADIRNLLQDYCRHDKDDWIGGNIEKVRNTFSWKSIADQYEELFRKVCLRD